jgi:hypothetical protein
MRETRSSGSVEGVVGNHDPYSDFLPRFSRGIKEASDSLLARPRAVFLGGAGTEEPKPAGRRQPKQKPAESPARRLVSLLALPARSGVRKGK